MEKLILHSNLYTKTKFSTKCGHWGFEELPDGRLYSDLSRATRVTEADIPEWYMYGKFYRNFGFINSKGVVDLAYEPNYVYNPMYNTDSLYISYNKPIDYKIRKDIFGQKRKYYKDYDHVIEGEQIATFISYIMKYSPDIDVKPIIQEIYKKLHWMVENYSDELEVMPSDRIAYLDSIFGVYR